MHVRYDFCSLILLNPQQYEAPPPERSKYVDSDDAAVLEDDSGRIILKGSFPIDDVVTGTPQMVCRV